MASFFLQNHAVVGEFGAAKITTLPEPGPQIEKLTIHPHHFQEFVTMLEAATTWTLAEKNRRQCSGKEYYFIEKEESKSELKLYESADPECFVQLSDPDEAIDLLRGLRCVLLSTICPTFTHLRYIETVLGLIYEDKEHELRKDVEKMFSEMPPVESANRLFRASNRAIEEMRDIEDENPVINYYTFLRNNRKTIAIQDYLNMYFSE